MERVQSWPDSADSFTDQSTTSQRLGHGLNGGARRSWCAYGLSPLSRRTPRRATLASISLLAADHHGEASLNGASNRSLRANVSKQSRSLLRQDDCFLREREKDFSSFFHSLTFSSTCEVVLVFHIFLSFLFFIFSLGINCDDDDF
mgnify:CR=1 FL=1